MRKIETILGEAMPADWTTVVTDAVESAGSASGMYRRKWKTIKGEAGTSRVTYEERKALAAKLRAAGLAFTPHLDGTPPGGEEWVVIIDAEDARDEDKIRFAKERPLEDLIVSAMPNMPGLLGVEFVGQQVKLGTKRLDLLGRKGVSGGRIRWYVIEVERAKTGESIEQVLRYGRTFRKRGARGKDIGRGQKPGDVAIKDGDEVTLVVIAQAGDPEDVHAASASQLRQAALNEGFHSKWIVIDIEAREVPVS
jgi:hypothetical protein